MVTNLGMIWPRSTNAHSCTSKSVNATSSRTEDFPAHRSHSMPHPHERRIYLHIGGSHWHILTHERIPCMRCSTWNKSLHNFHCRCFKTFNLTNESHIDALQNLAAQASCHVILLSPSAGFEIAVTLKQTITSTVFWDSHVSGNLYLYQMWGQIYFSQSAVCHHFKFKLWIPG